jgi:DNA helicase HerA-like ATPase
MHLLPFSVRGNIVEILSEKPLELGKLVLIKEGEREWLARIFGTESYSIARNPLEAMFRQKQHDYIEQQRIIEFVAKHFLTSYAINRATILCEVEGRGFKETSVIPTVECSIGEPDVELLKPLFKREIAVGRYKGYDIEVGIPKQVLNKHFGVIGKSGIGKTNLASWLIRSLWGHAKLLVIDYEADLSKNISRWVQNELRHRTDVKILSVSGEIPASDTLRINPSDFFVCDWENAGVVESKPQKYVMLRFERKDHNWLEDFLNGRDSLSSRDQKSWDAVERRLIPIIEAEVFDRSAPLYSLFKLIARLVESDLSLIVLELGELRDNSAALCLIVNYIARVLMSLRREQRLRHPNTDAFLENTQPIILVVDEAQEVLKPEAPSGYLRRLLHVARKNNIGIFLVTTYPSAIDIDTLRGLQTKFIMRLELEKDIQAVLDSTPYITREEVTRLGLGEALLYCDPSFGGYPFSVPLEVPPFTLKEATTLPELSSPSLDKMEERLNMVKRLLKLNPTIDSEKTK